MANLEPMKWFLDEQIKKRNHPKPMQLNENNLDKIKGIVKYKLEKINKYLKTDKNLKKIIIKGNIFVCAVGVIGFLGFSKKNEASKNDFSFAPEPIEIVAEEIIPTEIIKEEVSNPLPLTLGANYLEFANTLTDSEYASFTKYGEMYGVDPKLLFAIACQESSLKHQANIPKDGKSFNKPAIGICQIENLPAHDISAYNYITDCVDTLTLSLENMCDYDMNIQACAMKMQKNIINYHGNIYLALQRYNYGSIARFAVSEYANEIGSTDDLVKENYKDCGWIKYVHDIHNNPKKYYSEWEYDTYGDPNYINNVLRYFDSDTCTYYYNNLKCTFDFNTNELYTNIKTIN